MQVIKLLNTNSLLLNFSARYDFVNPNSIYAQSIRWWRRRKPKWLGPCKSKMFYVPPRPNIPRDEYVELERLNKNYKTQYKSLREFLVKMARMEEKMVKKTARVLLGKDDFDRCMDINDQWNKAIAEEREKKRIKHLEAIKNEVQEKKERHALKQKKFLEEIEEHVRQVKREAINLITKDNIDQAIDDALSITINYNEAMDSDGNFYKGKYEPNNQLSVEKQQIIQ